MKLVAVACLLLLGACAAHNSGVSREAPAPAGEANAFNPFLHKNLPNTRIISRDGREMLASLGAAPQSIEGEAAHRKDWRLEIYPVVYGLPTAQAEILVLLNFATPKSESVWTQVVQASRALSPGRCKIAVFGRSSENYGMDLMGLAIWIAHERKGQAMEYLSYALKRWNEVKAAQKASGQVKAFATEYDATARAGDYPIIYSYFSHLKPPVSAADQLRVGRYCYDAGKVNMYQAEQIARFYGVKSLPAVIVNGRVMYKPDARAILGALK